MLDRYEGTRLGRQELHGEMLEDVEGALWTWDMFQWIDEAPPLQRIVVGVDPAGSANEQAPTRPASSSSASGTTSTCTCWPTTPGSTAPAVGHQANEAYEEFAADAIVAEKNYGGEMVKHTLENSGYGGARIILVDSRRGKETARRAHRRPLREGRWCSTSGKQGDLSELEDEQTAWVPGEGPSPNRVDALVHGGTELAKRGCPPPSPAPNTS